MLGLILSLGCARHDWIDRTLVTENVTGAWFGSIGSMDDLRFDLQQEGGRVTGSFHAGGLWSSFIATSGAIDGTVAGDVFTFKDSRGMFRSEVIVSGDDMKGQITAFKPLRINLHRVDASASPTSLPQ